MSNSLGWTRDEQEKIVSTILDMEWQFRFRDQLKTKTIEANAKIKSNWYAWPWPHVYMEVLRINANAKITPPEFKSTINSTARIQPVLGGNAYITYGEEIQGNAKIVLGEEITADARIMPTLKMNARIIQPDLTARARIAYPREQAICSRARIAIGEWDISVAQGLPRIGNQRGCDLKGDLPLTGWRFIRDGRMEQIQHWSSTKVITRWVQRVTEIQFWFNPVSGDDGTKMLQAITNMLENYNGSGFKPIYVSPTKFKVVGNQKDKFFKGVQVQINTPEYCCKVLNREREEWHELMNTRRLYPYVQALANISDDKMRANAKIATPDLYYAEVVDSEFNGTHTVVELDDSYELKTEECFDMKWRQNFDSVVKKKHYYPLSANGRIQAYIRNTGKIYWLIGPPNRPGNEEDYAYLILEVGE